MEFKIVDNLNDFLKLNQPWNELVSQTNVDHAFMKHEWFERWLIDLDYLDGLYIVTAYSDGQLIGIAPTRKMTENFKGFNATTLSFLASSISPRCNFILNKSYNSNQFFEGFFNSIKNCDLISTMQMEKDQEITRQYLSYLSEYKPLLFTKELGRKSPYMVFDMNWDEYHDSRKNNFRVNSIHSTINRMKKATNVSIEMIDKFEDLEKIFEGIVEVSRKSWKAKQKTDLKSNPKLASFYKNFSRIGAKNNLWELWTLKIGGKHVAFEYFLKDGNVFSNIRCDFDEEQTYFRPGSFLKIEIFKELMNRKNMSVYDMGGADYAFKLNWVDDIRVHLNIMVAGKTFYGKFLIKSKQLLPKLRNLFSINKKAASS